MTPEQARQRYEAVKAEVRATLEEARKSLAESEAEAEAEAAARRRLVIAEAFRPSAN